jgi:hypothetical protein
MPHIVTFDVLIARQPGFQESDEFIKLGDIKGEFQADELTCKFDAVSGDREQPSFQCNLDWEFEPAAGMDSFGQSLNLAFEIVGQAGPGGTSFMTGQFDMPSDSISPGDGSRCLV